MKNLFTYKSSVKTPGNVIVISLFLSFFVLTLGTNLIQSLTKESTLTLDLLWSEKAYFASESGIEFGLLALKKEPAQSIDNYPVEVTNNTTKVTLNKKLPLFNVTLQPQKNIKMFLRKDIDETSLAYNPQSSFDTEFIVSSPSLYQWQIICPQILQTEDGFINKNASLQGISNESIFIPLYTNGTLDRFISPRETETEENSSLNDLLSVINNTEEQANCFLNLKNIHTSEITISTENGNITPPITPIVATSIVQNKEKTLQFNYAQKKLSSLFDFGIFHTEED